jgi:hypothetical protein
LAVFVRFILLAFFFELGIIFSIQATDGVVALAPQKDAQVIQIKLHSLRPPIYFLVLNLLRYKKKMNKMKSMKKKIRIYPVIVFFVFLTRA